METFEGQCQCGEVKYRVTGTVATLFTCHCTECQRQSSSAFGMALWVRNAALELASGALNNTKALEPVGHLWLASKQSWVQVPEGSLQYAGNPPDFEALLAA